MANTKVSLSRIESSNVDTTNYNPKDTELLGGNLILRQFGLENDYIEQILFDVNGNRLSTNYDYSQQKLNQVTPSSTTTDELTIDPKQDLFDLGYTSGEFKLLYNFFRKKITDGPSLKLYIKEISSDRTEIRVASNDISNSQIQDQVQAIINEIQSTPYYKDYLLNFGDNKIELVVNVALEQTSPQYSILFKLYEPLPQSYGIKDQLWLVERISDSIEYDLTATPDITPTNIPVLRAPNFDLDINDQLNKQGNYETISSLLSNSSSSFSQQVNSLLDENGVQLNIDYNQYNNFIHFSSAKERLSNFIYKLKLIEGYNNELSSLGTISGGSSIIAVSSSKNNIQDKINNIIQKFDGYEQFMYFESGSVSGSNSFTFPKQNTNVPYIPYSTTSPQAITYLGSDNSFDPNYGGQMLSASLYDRDNQDYLINTIPEFIREDEDNTNYSIFLDMIGQHFDNVWTYSKAMTDVYDARNKLTEGISQGLVTHALKSLGVKLYTNEGDDAPLFDYLIGPSASLSPSASISVSSTSQDQYTNEIYKRIYHNLPLLYKSKGTERGLRALIACYGIPDTILRISETGGADKTEASIEYDHNRFTYGLRTSGSIDGIDVGAGNISVMWNTLNANFTSASNQFPQAIELRFKPDNINPTSPYVQSLFEVGETASPFNLSSSLDGIRFKVELEKDPSVHTGLKEDYGYLRFTLVEGTSTDVLSSTDIELPFFDGSYYNILLNQLPGTQIEGTSNAIDTTYVLYAKNNTGKYTDNQEGERIGNQGSSSLFIPAASSSYYTNYNGDVGNTTKLVVGGNGPGSITLSNNNFFKGTFQELRYWGEPLNEDVFNFHVLNPESYEGNTTGSAYSKLALRLPLGNDLKITNIAGDYISSSHPGSTPNYIDTYTSTFANPFGDESRGYISGTLSQSFEQFTEQYYLNTPNSGILGRRSDKIRIVSSSVENNFLSPISRIEEVSDADITQDLHLMEVAFSPQNEINDDIVAQLGFFNIDDYIGNPQEESSVSYTKLEALKEHYFTKYTSNYNIFDYIKLIQYFDNSLFKMIKDYVPGRANVSTGIVIKPHILERNKQARLPLEVDQHDYSGSIDIVSSSADSGGVYETSGFSPSLNDYQASLPGNLGIVNQVGTHNEEFITGEIGGSVINSVKGPNNPFAKPNYN
ncbi:hypothetical protein OAA15_00025 [bacterium]|nr:hypothetical protein [bacterium]